MILSVMFKYYEFLRLLVAHGDSHDCLLWEYGRDTGGYGHFVRHKKVHRVHRASLELMLGRPIAEGFECCHTCRNRHCFAPKHLYEGTRLQNMRDMKRDGTHKFAIGSDCATSKLTEHQVIDIRNLYAGSAKPSIRKLAAAFKISSTQMHRILRNDCWKHV